MRVKRDPLRPATVFGLVVAGGNSRRMGVDKGTLQYHGKPQARYLCDLISGHVERVFVSVNASQQSLSPYSDLSLILDAEPRHGPATGLLAAHTRQPQVAWLVTAVDLVGLDDATIAALIRGRQPTRAATAMRHPDGTLEPLLAIWEPVGLELLAARVAEGDASPRRCLEAADTAVLICANPDVLRSIDTPSDRDSATISS